MKNSTYCGSAHCRKEHAWHESGLFLKSLNCGAVRTRTDEELQQADNRLLKQARALLNDNN